MRAHETWLLANSSQIASVENAVRSLTLFAPGQNNDVELLSEGVAALFQAVGVYQDQVAVRALASQFPDREVSKHSRYLATAMALPAYRVPAYTLSLVRCSELLLEMFARQKGGDSGRWRAVLGIEGVKATLRLTMLASTNRPLAYPTVYENEADPEELARLFGSSNIEQGQAKAPDSPLPSLAVDAAEPTWTMPRTNKSLPANPLDIRALLKHKCLASENLRPDSELMQPLSSLGLTGEVLSILRPLLYAMLAYRFRNRRRNWTPWVIGILIEVLARKLSQTGFARGGPRQTTTFERAQLQARTSSLWWWLLRGALYDTKTRPFIAAVATKLSGVPVLNIGGVLINDYLYLLDTYYFASASL